MKRFLIAISIFAVLAMPCSADVTIGQSLSGKGMGISGNTTGKVYIKGNRMRSETVSGGKTQTTIFDLDSQKMYIFDSKKKEAEVWDMAQFSEEVAGNVDVSAMKASVKPNGQTKKIGSAVADGYEMEISMPAALAGSKDMQMTATLTGPVWVVKNSPGAADYVNFYKAAAAKGFIFSDPKAAKSQPGQARAMTEMYNQLADIGGIAYETEVQIKMEGSGPLGGLLSRMGNITMTTVVDSVETAGLPDDLFMPPADYKLKTKK